MVWGLCAPANDPFGLKAALSAFAIDSSHVSQQFCKQTCTFCPMTMHRF